METNKHMSVLSEEVLEETQRRIQTRFSAQEGNKQAQLDLARDEFLRLINQALLQKPEQCPWALEPPHHGADPTYYLELWAQIGFRFREAELVRSTNAAGETLGFEILTLEPSWIGYRYFDLLEVIPDFTPADDNAALWHDSLLVHYWRWYQRRFDRLVKSLLGPSHQQETIEVLDQIFLPDLNRVFSPKFRVTFERDFANQDKYYLRLQRL